MVSPTIINCSLSQKRKSSMKSSNSASSIGKSFPDVLRLLKQKPRSSTRSQTPIPKTSNSKSPLLSLASCRSVPSQPSEAGLRRICMSDNGLNGQIDMIMGRSGMNRKPALQDYLDSAINGKFPPEEESKPDRQDCPIAITIGILNKRRGTKKTCAFGKSCIRRDKGNHPECEKPPYKKQGADNHDSKLR